MSMNNETKKILENNQFDNLQKVRLLLNGYKWRCPDIYHKWKEYLIDDLLYGGEFFETMLAGYLNTLVEDMERDAKPY